MATNSKVYTRKSGDRRNNTIYAYTSPAGTVYPGSTPTEVPISELYNRADRQNAAYVPYKSTPRPVHNFNNTNNNLVSNNQSSIQEVVEEPPLADYLYDDIYDEIYSSSGSGATKVDVTALLNAYKQQADANNANALQAYTSKRDALLQQIKRAYAQNALSTTQQNQAFINSMADLEASNMANTRGTRVQAGQMGLSGSGIQQLAQLKVLLGQANKVAEVSSKNEAALAKLRDSLATGDAKTMASLDEALNEYTKDVLGANNKMATNSANTVMDAETAYANALRSAQSSENTYSMAANMVTNTLNGTTDALRYTLKYISNMKVKELKQYAKNNGIDIKGIKSKNLKDFLSKQAADAAQQTIYALNEAYSINPATYNTAYANIANLLKYYKL